jgi:XRE family aerobic/anaerobic benzoate catabolism transcriptional regulator
MKPARAVAPKPVRSKSTVGERVYAESDTSDAVEPPNNESGLHRLLAQRVRAARAARGMTRKQLARHSRISLAYLARIESGTGNISLGLLFRLAESLNLPLESFLSRVQTHSADFMLILEFLKRQTPAELARIRRQLFDRDDAGSPAAKQRIALLGIRGVGKSTLGPLLAERLGVPFVELNRQIEAEAGLAVAEILNVYGQHNYRQLERRCLERVVMSYPKVVLATGGGIVTEPATYELLMSSFYTVWLKAKPQVMFARVMAQHDARIARPQLRGEALKNIERTLEARKHLYELADLTFDTSGRSSEQAARALAAALGPGLGDAPAVSEKRRARL